MSRLGLLWQLGKAKRNARLLREKIEQLQQKNCENCCAMLTTTSPITMIALQRRELPKQTLTGCRYPYSLPLTNAFCWIDSAISSPSKGSHRKTYRDSTKQPELTASHIWINIMWCILLAVPENRDISFMITVRGTPCSSVSFVRHCGIYPCHRL